jgi:hypothetical protein
MNEKIEAGQLEALVPKRQNARAGRCGFSEWLSSRCVRSRLSHLNPDDITGLDPYET